MEANALYGIHVYCMYSSKTRLENYLINRVKSSRCNLMSQIKEVFITNVISVWWCHHHKQFSFAASKCTRTRTKVRNSIPLKKNNSELCCWCQSLKNLTSLDNLTPLKNINNVLTCIRLNGIIVQMFYRQSWLIAYIATTTSTHEEITLTSSLHFCSQV